MKPDFNKGDGLIPAIIQDVTSSEVLMLGYMNEESLAKTLKDKKVCFYSRSKKRLWTKGESSGNYLHLDSILQDCDNDTLLVKVNPEGPVCHTGTDTCFGERSGKGFLYRLQEIISKRIEEKAGDSYTYRIFSQGINKVAQKVGEEAVEVVIEAKDNNRQLFINEAADLLYHLLILMKKKDINLEDVEEELLRRHK